MLYIMIYKWIKTRERSAEIRLGDSNFSSIHSILQIYVFLLLGVLFLMRIPSFQKYLCLVWLFVIDYYFPSILQPLLQTLCRSMQLNNSHLFYLWLVYWRSIWFTLTIQLQRVVLSILPLQSNFAWVLAQFVPDRCSVSDRLFDLGDILSSINRC